jgi:hypothetical protein
MSKENREIMPGETMFEYLKRKKRFLLEKAVSRPATTHRQPLLERSCNGSMDNDKTRREDQYERDESRD